MSNLSLRQYALKNSAVMIEMKRLRNIDKSNNEREKKRFIEKIEKMNKDINKLKETIKKMNTVQKGRFQVLTRNKSSKSNSFTKKEKKEKFDRDIARPLN